MALPYINSAVMGPQAVPAYGLFRAAHGALEAVGGLAFGRFSPRPESDPILLVVCVHG